MERWYIIQTRSRWEKKVADSLEQRGIESYCPVKKVSRKWSDRIKIIEEPLFRCCVLVRVAPEQWTEVRLLDGVVNFVYENGKPAQVKEKQVQMLRKGLSTEVSEDNNGSSEVNGQQKAFRANLELFSVWIKGCMERPKLI